VGIKTGSGGGSNERPGKRGINLHALNQGLMGTRTPRPAAANIPSPEKPPFRLGIYEILEEKDDYLVCRGFDPNAVNPFAEVTPSAQRTIDVAKPPLLMRTPWDGVDPVEIGGVEYTFEYDTDIIGVRTAFWTDEDDVDQEVEETIDIPYFVGDMILAVEVALSPVVDGMEVNGSKTRTDSDDDDGALITWVDCNVSGRHWQGAVSATCDDRNEIHQITLIGGPTAGTFTLTYIVNAVSGTVTINWNSSAAAFKTALAGHAQIATTDLTVTGGPLPNATINVEFIDTLAHTAIPVPTANWASLIGTGLAAIISRPQSGYPD